MNPYVIFQTGGKQYKICKGDVIDVELIEGVDTGSEILFKEVLLFFDGSFSKIGSPFVENAVIKAEYLSPFKGEKVVSYKYKRRKNYRRKVGHRQNYMRIQIKDFLI